MPNKQQVHNPIFARFYVRTAELAEAKGASEHRDELLAGLSGRVIEVGAGTGANFSHYPESVTEVIAVEPEPYLRHLAERAAAQAPVAIKVIDGVADDLPARDDEFDAGVASLVLLRARPARSAPGAASRDTRGRRPALLRTRPLTQAWLRAPTTDARRRMAFFRRRLPHQP